MVTKVRSKTFTYRSKVTWVKERKGELEAIGKPKIDVATPPEFKGHEGIWAPEDLFVASINACIMTTFLFLAERQGVDFTSYESEAEGVLERIEREFMFSRVTVYPRIVVANKEMAETAKEALEMSERYCFISSSVKSRIEVQPEIRISH